MKLEVTIEKKYVFFLAASLLILAGAITSYAFTASPGAVPNPGHALAEIQGYFSGDANLQNSLGRFCQSDGTNCVPGSVPTGVTRLYWCNHNGGFAPGQPAEAGAACSLATNIAQNPSSGYRAMGCTVTLAGVKYLAGNLREFQQQWWGDISGWIRCDDNTILVAKIG